MDYQDILYRKQNNIAWISLNRPKVLNALSPNLVIELKHAFMEVFKDDDIRIAVLTGEGKAFSAGVDLKKMNETIQGGNFTESEILEVGKEMINLIQTMPKVTIAMVNGYCFTGAMELMLTFDLIYAAEDAQIGDTHAKWGIIPKWGMSQRLPQLVGVLKARELSFTAKTVSGKEAERIGLVNKAVPLDQLKATVEGVAKDIAQNSPQTIAAIKSLYYQGMHTTLKEGLDIEAEAEFEITDREDELRGFLSKN